MVVSLAWGYLCATVWPINGGPKACPVGLACELARDQEHIYWPRSVMDCTRLERTYTLWPLAFSMVSQPPSHFTRRPWKIGPVPDSLTGDTRTRLPSAGIGGANSDGVPQAPRDARVKHMIACFMFQSTVGVSCGRRSPIRCIPGLDELLEFIDRHRRVCSVDNRMAVGAQGDKVTGGVNLILASDFGDGRDVVYMNEAPTNVPIYRFKVEAAGGAGQTMVGDRGVSCISITLIPVHIDSGPVAFPEFASGGIFIGVDRCTGKRIRPKNPIDSRGLFHTEVWDCLCASRKNERGSVFLSVENQHRILSANEVLDCGL